MTVQELIDALNKVENKSALVVNDNNSDIEDIEDLKDYIILYCTK